MGADGHLTAHANGTAARTLALAWAYADDAWPGTRPPVRHVVAAPGSRHTPLLLAFVSAPGVRVHMVLDERAAGFVALGLAKATGRAVVLCCTSGSAGAHFLPAVVEADAACVPLLVVTADRPPELCNSGAPQTMPQGDLFAAYVRGRTMLPTPDPTALDVIVRAWRRQCAQALSRAEGMRPGPVHLNAPFREPLWDKAMAIEATPALSAMQVLPTTPRLAAQDAWHLARRCAGAQRGLVVVGPMPPGAASDADTLHIARLAQQLGWPVLVDGASQMRSFGAELASGAAEHQVVVVTCADMLCKTPAFIRACAAPDMVLRFGQLPTSKALWTWLGDACAQAGTTTVLIDAHGLWADPTQTADLCVAVSSAHFCDEMMLCVAPFDTPSASEGQRGWRLLWQHHQRAAHAAIRAELSFAPSDVAARDAPETDDAISEAEVAFDLCTMLPKEALLHVASSMPIRDVDTFDQRTADAVTQGLGPHLSVSRGVNGIDGTLATVLGLALAWPSGPVAALMGDLAFLHDVGSLQLARQLQAPALVVVVNNDGGDIFSHLPIAALDASDLPNHGHAAAMPFDAYFRTPQKADIKALCRAAHVGFCSVTTRQQWRRALQEDRIFAPGGAQSGLCGLRVIEVHIDAAHSRRARKRVQAAVAQALVAL